MSDRKRVIDGQGGDGPTDVRPYSQQPYHHPAAGWGAAVSVGQVLVRSGEPLRGVHAMLKMNHENGGFDCPGCAWPDATDGLKLDLCENGVKHVTWEMTGFRIKQPARELAFVTPSGRAEFSPAPLPDVIPHDADVLVLQTMRSHDQWNTTIYSDDDRYRGVKNLRTLLFMHPDDMAARGLAQGQLVDIEATSRDGSVRRAEGFRVLAYALPRGSAAGYMPELNVLIGLADYSTQSDQPLMKNVKVRVTASRTG